MKGTNIIKDALKISEVYCEPALGINTDNTIKIDSAFKTSELENLSVTTRYTDCEVINTRDECLNDQTEHYKSEKGTNTIKNVSNTSDVMGLNQECTQQKCVMGINNTEDIVTVQTDCGSKSIDKDRSSVANTFANCDVVGINTDHEMGLNNQQCVDTNLIGVDTDNNVLNAEGMIGTSKHDMTGINNDDISVVESTETDFHSNDQTVSGINKHYDVLDDTLSSFEGFTAADIMHSEMDQTADMSVSSPSSPSDTFPESECNETELDSGDSNLSKSSDSKQFNPTLDIKKIWIHYATTRKWEVTMIRMSRKKIYELSNPPPNWDEIDPYCSLEETNIGSQMDLKCVEDSNSDATIILTESLPEKENRYLARTLCKNTTVRRSLRTKTVQNYQESNYSSSEDSDYNPHSRCTNQRVAGLREPTRSRMRAQKLISAKRESVRSPECVDSEKTFPVRATQCVKDKKCPLCLEVFFFTSSISTHLAHAHQDDKEYDHPATASPNRTNPPNTSDVMGLNIENTPGINRENVPGLSNNKEAEDVMGTNIQPASTLSSQTLSDQLTADGKPVLSAEENLPPKMPIGTSAINKKAKTSVLAIEYLHRRCPKQSGKH